MTGSILKGRVTGITLNRKMDKVLGKRTVLIEVPSVLFYDNRPEYGIQEFSISDLTRETLKHRIRDAYDQESQRIRLTSSR